MNAWTWLLQRISAFVLLIVLGLHIWFLHFAHGGEVLHYSEIIKRLGAPIFITMDILLLIFGLFLPISLDECAQIMNRSQRAVQGLVDRAKKKLRATLGRLSKYD